MPIIIYPYNTYYPLYAGELKWQRKLEEEKRVEE
jgi:hypothetical protein